ncbi:MAG: right-handed parallel beta-helix repeat-containing protein, partial [Deltaproteobacteria bacterium]|nr:right-handed parallel beta-helix repeat-containing protein [Deltaproteobacteria bacterium]
MTRLQALLVGLLAGCSAGSSPVADGGTTEGPLDSLPLDTSPHDVLPPLDAARCISASCVYPPPPRCFDGTTREVYDARGVCVDGRCEYGSRQESCATRCLAGICLVATHVLHVDGRNAGSEDGSVFHPFRTINAALAADDGEAAIFVAAGTYRERIKVVDKRVELAGGFAGGSATEYTEGTGGDFTDVDPHVHITVLNAPSGPSLSLTSAGASLIYGLTITGAGRGILCQRGSPTVASCTLVDNNAGQGNGGGLLAEDACALHLRDSLIEGNQANRGGGVAAYEGSVEVRGCVVRNNEGHDDHGGGLYLQGVVDVHDNWIEGNRVGLSLGYGWGGGMVVLGDGTSARLSGNVVTGNSAPSAGGGVFIDDGTDAEVQNELYFKNSCGELGGAGLYVDGLSSSIRTTATLKNITIADHGCAGELGGGLLVENAT